MFWIALTIAFLGLLIAIGTNLVSNPLQKYFEAHAEFRYIVILILILSMVGSVILGSLLNNDISKHDSETKTGLQIESKPSRKIVVEPSSGLPPPPDINDRRHDLISILLFDKGLSMNTNNIKINNDEIREYIRHCSQEYRKEQYICILIQEDSYNQTPYISDIIKDGDSSEGVEKILCRKLQEPNKSKMSDVQGAVELAKNIFDRYEISDIQEINIIIYSDLLGDKKTEEIYFPCPIYIIGSKKKECYVLGAKNVNFLPVFKTQYLLDMASRTTNGPGRTGSGKRGGIKISQQNYER